MVRRTPFLCRCAFWFFVSASLVFVAAASKENEATVRATPSSSTSTVLRAEKWPLGHGGVRIFYYASNEEESEGEDADDNAVELSIVAGDDERLEAVARRPLQRSHEVQIRIVVDVEVADRVDAHAAQGRAAVSEEQKEPRPGPAHRSEPRPAHRSS